MTNAISVNEKRRYRKGERKRMILTGFSISHRDLCTIISISPVQPGGRNNFFSFRRRGGRKKRAERNTRKQTVTRATRSYLQPREGDGGGGAGGYRFRISTVINVTRVFATRKVLGVRVSARSWRRSRRASPPGEFFFIPLPERRDEEKGVCHEGGDIPAAYRHCKFIAVLSR